MTATALNTSTSVLAASAVSVLATQGYAFDPLRQSFNEFLALAATGISGSTVSNLRYSRAELLAIIANASGSGPVSHLTSSVNELLALVGGSDPLAPGAPVLTWTTGVTDNTPSLNIDFDASVVETDVVTIERAPNAGFTGSSTATDTLDAIEIAASNIDLALSALADGNWYVRAKIAHGASVSAWSNTVLMTIRAGDNSRIGLMNLAIGMTDMLPAPVATIGEPERRILLNLDGYVT